MSTMRMSSKLYVLVIAVFATWFAARADAAPAKFDATIVPAGTTWWCGSVPMCFRAKPACEKLIGPCKSQTTAWAYTDAATHDISVFSSNAMCKEDRNKRDSLSACTAVGVKAYKPGPKGSGYWCFDVKLGPVPSMCAREKGTCEQVHDTLKPLSACHASKTAWAFTIEEGDFSIDAPVVETKAHCTQLYDESLTAVGPCRELR